MKFNGEDKKRQEKSSSVFFMRNRKKLSRKTQRDIALLIELSASTFSCHQNIKK